MAEVAHVGLNENQARELTAKIYGHLDQAWELIKKAYNGRADMALGYASWDEYCKGEFHGSQLRLPLVKRREVVKTLTEAGLSTRAIASATGISRPTVMADQKAQVDNIGPVASTPGLDGKIRTRTLKTTDASATIVLDGTFTKTLPDAPVVAKVQATKDTRPSLVKKADDAAWALRKAVESLKLITTDVDYHVHRGSVELSIKGATEYAIQVLTSME